MLSIMLILVAVSVKGLVVFQGLGASLPQHMFDQGLGSVIWNAEQRW